MFIILINLASAYIDPGTGGYLVSSVWPTIATFLTVILATVGAFFSKYLIVPVKKFFNKIGFKSKKEKSKKKNKKWMLYLFLILVLILSGVFVYFKFFKTPIFDERLSGIHNYNLDKSFQGYNYYSGKLIDMNGNVVKNWSNLYLGVIDENGDYYAQKCFECDSWGRYSFDGEVIWEKNFPIHHEIILTEDSVITFSKEVVKYNERNVEFDVILEFDKNGTLIESFSLWNNLKTFQQFHKPLELDKAPSFIVPESHKKNISIWGGEYDYYHLNAMSLLPSNALENFTINDSNGKEIKPFQKGNWLISFRHGSMLFILDKDTKEVRWYINQFSIADELQGQHSPLMLPNGNILIFDNGRYREWSRLVVINPLNLNVEWEYKSEDFYTLSQGYVQVLPNFNLLVTEAEEGRVFEMTPEKEIVWEYYTPDRQNENNSVVEENFGKRQEIYRMTRYDKIFIDSLRWN